MGYLADKQADRLASKLFDRTLLRPSHKSLIHWFEQFKSTTADLDSSLDRAVLGGRTSTCMAYAFAAGYQSAIHALFNIADMELSSLCVSEAQGNHPRTIASTLSQYQGHWCLNGSKTFITGGQEARHLYVVCNTGQTENDRPVLKMLTLPANLPGIEITDATVLPFVPEVSHGAAHFNEVQVDQTQILPGDGYQDYVKPFRTLEDIHVFAAILGFLLGQALESKWPTSRIESIFALTITLRSISQMPVSKATTHIALAGCRSQMDSLIEQVEQDFKQFSPNQYANWQRDKALLTIASKAHVKRTEKAWTLI